jgi:hypothetical protein
MKSILSLILVLFCASIAFGQQEFHVFPKTHKTTPGSQLGNGSLEHPWDLQTALFNKKDVRPGHTIWIHEGIYNGRYESTINGSSQKKILVAAYQGDKVVLNGNIPSQKGAVLHVVSSNVIFKNFEVTLLGTFTRNVSEQGFNGVAGINHTSGEDCKFSNLKIYNVTSVGFGTWKRTGGTIIENCMVFNNGSMGPKRGNGEGFYVQNKSDKTRIIRNNLIFNNYYKGVEVWSASKGHNYEFVKNVRLQDNVVFNNGLPSGHHRGNVIVATNDHKGINRAKNIALVNNILYHNIDLSSNKKNYGDGSSLNIGYNIQAPPENIVVRDNVIIGNNNALGIYNTRGLTFENNTIYSGYIHIGKNASRPIDFDSWSFKTNKYVTRKSKMFLLNKKGKMDIKQWRSMTKLDENSSRASYQEFSLKPILHISEIDAPIKTFQLALFNKEGMDVSVDFTAYNIEEETEYNIKNIEDGTTIKSGMINANRTVVFPMGTYNQTAPNCGVYLIELIQKEVNEKKKRKGFFKRLFGWLF